MRYQISSFQLLNQMLELIPEGDACLEWPRCVNDGGYGNVVIDYKSMKVHRVAYCITKGPIPEGLDVCHKCDNPRCFRPSHLFAGTVSDNVRDCVAKGRARRSKGESHYEAKMTDDSARAAIVLHAGGWTLPRIAAKYGVSKSVIAHIVHRRTWKHI